MAIQKDAQKDIQGSETVLIPFIGPKEVSAVSHAAKAIIALCKGNKDIGTAIYTAPAVVPRRGRESEAPRHIEISLTTTKKSTDRERGDITWHILFFSRSRRIKRPSQT